mgnify:CR=1 FL=1
MDSTSHDEHSAAPSEASDTIGAPTDSPSPLPQRGRRSRGGTGIRRWSRRRKIVVGLSTAVMTTALALGAVHETGDYAPRGRVVAGTKGVDGGAVDVFGSYRTQ